MLRSIAEDTGKIIIKKNIKLVGMEKGAMDVKKRMQREAAEESKTEDNDK